MVKKGTAHFSGGWGMFVVFSMEISFYCTIKISAKGKDRVLKKYLENQFRLSLKIHST
jgi:hypothetical protein